MRQTNGRSTIRRVLDWFTGSRQETASAARPRRARTDLCPETLERRDCPATLQAFADTLISASRADATRTIKDIATIEVYRPTLGASALYNDLVRINSDVNAGAPLVRLFSDFAPLVTHLSQELSTASARHLPLTAAVANYTAVQNDLKAVGGDYALTVILLKDLTAHAQTTVMPTSAPVSGLNQVYSDLNTMGRWGGMTPSQNPALQGLIQSIPSSAWSKDPGVIGVNQMIDKALGGF